MRLTPILLTLAGFLALPSRAPAVPSIQLEDAAVIDQPIFQDNLEPISKFLMQSIGKRSQVHLIINSPGGSVFDGFSFLSKLDYARSKGVLVKCYVPEVAASMAFQILLHCDQRYALRRAGLLWHRVSIQVRGASLNALNTGDLLRDLKAIDAQIIRDLEENLDTPRHTILFHLNKETLHLAPDLQLISPGFFQEIPDTVDGLFEAMDSTKVVHQSNPTDFLKRLFGGEIFYIQRGFLLEIETNTRQTAPTK